MPDYRVASEAFTYIYDHKVWGGGSGASSPDVTRPYMRLLADFMRNNGVRTVVDVGCGDWQFSRCLDWTGVRYHGFDVVESVIEANRRAFATETITFDVLRSITDLPDADLVVCKDVFQHLPIADIQANLDYFLVHYRYVVVTNDVFPEDRTNADILPGGCRSLRLDLPPFNRQVASLLKWEITAPGHRWIKNTCLVTRPRARPSGWLSRFRDSA